MDDYNVSTESGRDGKRVELFETNKTGKAINFVFACLLFVATILILLFANEEPYVVKFIVIVILLACVIFNVLYASIVFKPRGKGVAYIAIVASGLLFACCGDMLYLSHVFLSLSLFGVAHLIFLSSLIVISGVKVRDAVISLIVFGCGFLIINLNPAFQLGYHRTFVIVYTLIMSLLLGKSISMLFEINNKWIYALIMVGIALLFIANLMKLFYEFAGNVKIFNVIAVSTYYPAVMVLAFSLFIVGGNYIAYHSNNKSVKHDNAG